MRRPPAAPGKEEGCYGRRFERGASGLDRAPLRRLPVPPIAPGAQSARPRAPCTARAARCGRRARRPAAARIRPPAPVASAATHGRGAAPRLRPHAQRPLVVTSVRRVGSGRAARTGRALQGAQDLDLREQLSSGVASGRQHDVVEVQQLDSARLPAPAARGSPHLRTRVPGSPLSEQGLIKAECLKSSPQRRRFSRAARAAGIHPPASPSGPRTAGPASPWALRSASRCDRLGTHANAAALLVRAELVRAENTRVLKHASRT